MKNLVFQGRTIETDDHGYIQDFDAWSEELAQHLADKDGMGTLTPDHWKVLYYLRNYYREYELAPPIRMLCKETSLTLKNIYRLFPAGPAKGACKLAGLPRPTGCV